MDADGRFTITGVPAGMYTFRINGRPPAGWILRSVMVNGADAADTFFEVGERDNIEGIVVTLTDRPAEISGVLQNADELKRLSSELGIGADGGAKSSSDQPESEGA